MPFKCYIAGADVSDYFKGMEVDPSGDATIGQGRLYLDAPAGGLTIENMMPVEVWKTFDESGAGIAAGGRLFGGVIKVRDTGTQATTKTWVLDCWDNNVILQTVVRDVQSVKAVHLTADSFANQIIACVEAIQLNGYASVNTEIDANTGVVDFWPTMPEVTYEGGHELGWYLEQLELTARGITASGGAITSVTVTDGGTGYTAAPTVTVAPPPPGGTQATITANITAVGSVGMLTVTAAGTGFTTATVAITGGGGTGATGTVTVTGGHVTAINVTNGGTGYGTPPTVTITLGGGSGATATAAVSGGAVTVVTVTNQGSAYTSAPTVAFGGPGTGAAATAVIAGSDVTALNITNAGSGFTSVPSVVVSAPGGGGTTATATATISGGRITSLVILTGGSGYTTPIVAFSGGSGTGANAVAQVTAGGVSDLVLISGGSGYTSAPAVAITSGGGSGATASAFILGHVSSLTLTNAGRGYPSPPAITFESTDGSGATAVATVSAVTYDILPAHYMGVGTTFGAVEVFGPPVLNIYDQLDTPAISLSFSDIVAGGRKGIYGEFRRVTDASMPIVQRQQATWGTENLVVTSESLPSQETYPNPYINHGGPDDSGAWMLPALHDDNATSFAEAQAALDRVIAVKAFPRDTYSFDTEERVFPGDTIGLGWALEGIADDTPMRVAKVSIVIEPPETVLSTLTVNTRRLGMFDDGTEGVFAPPIEGDPLAPEPPATFVLSINTYNGEDGDAYMTFTIGASPSPDVAGYRIRGYVGHVVINTDVGTNLTPTLIFRSNLAYSLQAHAYDQAGNISAPTPPFAPLQGTTAVPIYEVVPNADFDNFDRVDSTLPFHWARTVANGGTATYNTASNTGPACVKLSTTGTGGSTATITSSLTVAKGAVYAVQFYANSNTSTPNVSVFFDWYDNVQAFISSTTFDKALTTSYAKYTGTMTRPAGAAFFKVRYLNNTLSRDIRVDTAKYDPQTPNDGLEVIEDASKIALWQSSGSPRYLKDSGGTIRGQEYTDSSHVIWKGVNTGGSAPVSMQMESSTGHVLFLDATGAGTGSGINALDTAYLAGDNGNNYVRSEPTQNTFHTSATTRRNIFEGGGITLPAGTATAATAPLKLTSGTNLTTSEAGAVEYDGTALYATPVVDRHSVNLASTPITSTTSVTNSNAETTVFTGAISASELKAARAVKINVCGDYITNLTGHTATVKLKMAGTQIAAFTLPASPGGAAISLDGSITIRTTGAPGTAFLNVRLLAGTAINQQTSAATTPTTSSACDITVTWQWSAASTNDVANITQGWLEFIK